MAAAPCCCMRAKQEQLAAGPAEPADLRSSAELCCSSRSCLSVHLFVLACKHFMLKYVVATGVAVCQLLYTGRLLL